MKSLIKLILIFVLTCDFANAQNAYTFKVYLKEQMIDVFLEGVLLKKIPCSTGIKPGSTPTGAFRTFQRKEKSERVRNGTKICYYYITKINNNFSFHSLIEGNHFLVDEGKRLYKARKPSSNGCIRLKKEDAKWIYDLPLGIAVEVIDG